MVTLNAIIETDNWSVYENIVALSNASNNDIEVWIGTEAPTKSNLGHILTIGVGLDTSIFGISDKVWVRAKTGQSIITITKR